jgi:hypothetical protein
MLPRLSWLEVAALGAVIGAVLALLVEVFA